MNISTASKALFDAIADRFLKHGFKLNRSKKTFRRKINGVTQELCFLFDPSADGVLLTVALFVTNDQIEEVFARATGKASNFHLSIRLLDVKTYYELDVPLIKPTRDRFIIPDDEHLDILAGLLINYFEKYALRYFSDTDSVQKIDKLLNRNPGETTAHHWIYPSRAAIALIAAKLSANPEFDELSRIYLDSISLADEFFRTPLEQVVQMLKIT